METVMASGKNGETGLKRIKYVSNMPHGMAVIKKKETNRCYEIILS